MSVSELKNATSNKVTQPKNLTELQQFIAHRMGQIKSVIAGKLTPEKMARIALNELRGNDYLARTALQNPSSFVNAVIQASHLGLEIGGILGQAYLVPFKGEIKMMPGYRGLISLARRSGEINSISAEVVYENDEFDLELGLSTKVKHRPKLDGDRGEPVIAYMVAHFRDGGSHFEWMTVAEIMKIKMRSSAVIAAIKNKKETPWDTDRDEMIKKTVVRRGWKYLPMSIEMQSASVVDTAMDTGRHVVVEDGSIVVDESTGEIVDPNLDDQNPNSDNLDQNYDTKKIEQDNPSIKPEDIIPRSDKLDPNLDAPTPEEQEKIKQQLINESKANS